MWKKRRKNRKKRWDNFKNLLKYISTLFDGTQFLSGFFRGRRMSGCETHWHPILLLTSSDSVHSPRTDQNKLLCCGWIKVNGSLVGIKQRITVEVHLHVWLTFRQKLIDLDRSVTRQFAATCRYSFRFRFHSCRYR